MAASSEGKKDLGVLSAGTDRDTILAELGTPVTSVRENGENYDIFKFKRERSSGSNAGRAVLYGTAAVLTLGISEVIATPLEAAAEDLGEIQLRTFYDDEKTLTKAEVRTEEGWVLLDDFLADEEKRWKEAQTS